MPDAEDEYRQLLRWYPRPWRDENEDVIVSTFLEVALARHQMHPTVDERLRIAFGGVRQRGIGTGQRSLAATIAFAAGIAFEVVYSSPISWDPKFTYNGYVGPLANPTLIVGVVLALALMLNIRRVTAAARMLAVLASVAGVVIGVLSWGFGSLGPTGCAVAIFAAFGAGGLSQSNSIGRGFLLAAASLSALFAAFCLGWMLQGPYGIDSSWPEELALAGLGIVAAGALTTVSRRLF